MRVWTAFFVSPAVCSLTYFDSLLTYIFVLHLKVVILSSERELYNFVVV